MDGTSSSKLQKPIVQAPVFLIITFLQFVMIECFLDAKLTDFSPIIVIKNLAIIGCVNLILVGIFHGLRAAMIVSVVFFTLVGIVNYFVIAFRGYGVVFMDLYAIKTAATVAGSYEYTFTWRLVGGILLGTGLLVLSIFIPKRVHNYKNVKMTFISLSGIAVSCFFLFWTQSDTVFYKDVSNLSWDHSIGMRENGYILYFTANAGKATVTEPTEYSEEAVDKLLSGYTSDSATVENKKPNIIMIMNEAFSDLSVLGMLPTNQEVLPFYNRLTKNVVKGYAHSSVYGGYTANSEFEFLTGCSKAFLPGNPYLQYIDGKLPSLISTLKAQGYEEAVAVHPYNPSGYNRNRVYPLLGFDSFLSIRDFSQENLVRDYVGDWENYQKIIELYEQKEKGEPLCVFNVTMQNHGAYYDTDYEFASPVSISGFNPDSSANQYLSLIKMSDDALEKLIRYFEKVEEPTVILLFGDHQPHLSDGFYRYIVGAEPDFFTQEQVMNKHKVPYMIWANYEIEEETVEPISLNYLSSLLLKTAGLEMTNFQKYLTELQKKLPSVSACGYYDSKGDLYSYTDDVNENYTEWLRQYEMIQYNYLFGGDKRLNHHFELSAASRTARAN